MRKFLKNIIEAYHYHEMISDNIEMKRIDLNNIKMAFDRHEEDTDTSRHVYLITSLLITKCTDKYIILNIKLIRPGMIIGKAGNNLDLLNATMNTYTRKDVKINIIEDKLWMYNHNKN